VEKVAAGLSGLGFEAVRVLLTLSQLRVVWLVAALAGHPLGGTVLPLEPEAGDAELRVAAETARARFVLAEGARELERLLPLSAGLAPGALFFHIETRGIAEAGSRRLGLLEATDAVVPEPVEVPLAPAFIGFERTSEGVRRHATHHGALVEQARRTSIALSADDELWLDASLGFAAERLTGLAAWLDAGARLGLGESADTQDRDRCELGPTRIVASSAWYEALWRDLEPRLPPPGSLRRALVSWALRVGQARASLLLRVVAEVLVLYPLSEALGLARVQKALLYGAPPSRAVEALFAALDVPLSRDDVPSTTAAREAQLARTELGLSVVQAVHGE
jgi:long-subunit acyl-CoA synthetase (AMP-forming)